MPVIENPDVRDVTEVPAGYRGLGRCISETQRAYLFEYYGQELFIPKKVVVRCEGGCWAPKWAVESSQKYNSERAKGILMRKG